MSCNCCHNQTIRKAQMIQQVEKEERKKINKFLVEKFQKYQA